MKDKIIPVLIVPGFSLFSGFIGLGGLDTLTSPLNRIAGPMVCGDKQFKIEIESYGSSIQGEQNARVSAYCVDPQTGQKQDVSVGLLATIHRLQIITGLIISLIVFLLAMLILTWAARRLGISISELFKPGARRG